MDEEKPQEEKPRMRKASELYTAKQVLELLGLTGKLTTTSLIRKARARKVPWYQQKLGRIEYLFDPDEVRPYLELRKRDTVEVNENKS